MHNAWPAIPYADWAPTCPALHRFAQIVGKYRLAHTPWVNHSWHATLYVTPRGLTTGVIPDGERAISLDFDVCDQALVASDEGGRREGFPLEPMSVADFLHRTRRAVEALGGRFEIHGRPNELPDGTPFVEDREKPGAPRRSGVSTARSFRSSACCSAFAPAFSARSRRSTCFGAPWISPSPASRGGRRPCTRAGSPISPTP
jgi:hypothetical protein